MEYHYKKSTADRKNKIDWELVKPFEDGRGAGYTVGDTFLMMNSTANIAIAVFCKIIKGEYHMQEVYDLTDEETKLYNSKIGN
jgi:hypothetical protein